MLILYFYYSLNKINLFLARYECSCALRRLVVASGSGARPAQGWLIHGRVYVCIFMPLLATNPNLKI